MVGPVLGDGPRPAIERALDDLGVQVILGRRLTGVRPAAVELSDGSVIETATAIWTGGLAASPLTSCIGGARDDLGRLVVDQFLRVPGTPAVFAAGDTAAAQDPAGHRVLQSCQHAIPLGKFAGHNAASDLLGRALERFDPGRTSPAWISATPEPWPRRLGPGGPAHRRGGEGDEEGHLRVLHLSARQ